MTIIETILRAEPLVNMPWDRVLFLRSVGLDATMRWVDPYESPAASRYEAGELDGTEPPEVYGLDTPEGYLPLMSGPSEDGECVWAIYARPLTMLGQRLLADIGEAECREVAHA